MEKAAEWFLAARRPPPEIRSKLGIGWRLEDQSLFIFEIRPVWNNPSEYKEYPFAKASFVKSQGIWKIYWLLFWVAHTKRINTCCTHNFSVNTALFARKVMIRSILIISTLVLASFVTAE